MNSNGYIRGIAIGNHTYQFPEIEEEKQNGPISSLPQEVIREIFSYLTIADLKTCLLVDKTWTVLASSDCRWDSLILKKITFDKDQWEKYFGTVGEVPPLPTDIHEILKSPCPFFPEKKVWQTHTLVLIPETVDGKPLNGTTFLEMAKAPKKEYFDQYQDIRMISSGLWVHDPIYKTTVKSHWALMTKNIIPGSYVRPYNEQETLITEIAKKTGINYEVPNALDAMMCKFFVPKEGLMKKLAYYLSPEVTHCQEIQPTLNAHLYVGNLLNTLIIGYSSADPGKLKEYRAGVTALRKFF